MRMPLACPITSRRTIAFSRFSTRSAPARASEVYATNIRAHRGSAPASRGRRGRVASRGGSARPSGGARETHRHAGPHTVPDSLRDEPGPPRLGRRVGEDHGVGTGDRVDARALAPSRSGPGRPAPRSPSCDHHRPAPRPGRRTATPASRTSGTIATAPSAIRGGRPRRARPPAMSRAAASSAGQELVLLVLGLVAADHVATTGSLRTSSRATSVRDHRPFGTMHSGRPWGIDPAGHTVRARGSPRGTSPGGDAAAATSTRGSDSSARRPPADEIVRLPSRRRGRLHPPPDVPRREPFDEGRAVGPRRFRSRRDHRPRAGPRGAESGARVGGARRAGRGRRLVGVREDRPAVRTVTAVYGARELAHGAGILSGRGTAGWVWSRVAGDVLDVATVVAGAWRKGAVPARLGPALAALAGVTVADVATARALSRRSGAGECRASAAVTVNRCPSRRRTAGGAISIASRSSWRTCAR